jgi:2-amino-4-hydroxy-6-hydroxymethyldihydropteridine diphosphokinase
MSAGPVIIALGANLGEPGRQLVAAMDRLEALAGAPIRRSSLWETTPVNCPPGSPRFANAVVVFAPQPAESPESLLLKLQALEREFGRVPKLVLNEARPLDLDLIAWGCETRSHPQLTLPHPRAHEREFVLRPLAEVWPEFVLPGQLQGVGALLAALSPDPRFRRLADHSMSRDQ